MNNLIELKSKNTQSVARIFIVDATILLILFALPTISHQLPFPLFLIEPMRIMVLASYLFTNKQNGLMIGMAIPIFSSLTSGHPIFLKSILISLELVSMLLVLDYLKSKINDLFSLTIAIFISKAIYYCFKALFIIYGFLGQPLISTSFKFQLISPIMLLIILFIISFFKKTIIKTSD